ncbi:hypothetical protein PFISCL1PPCAC_15544, partial [Pristionchus fissidentatus]
TFGDVNISIPIFKEVNNAFEAVKGSALDKRRRVTFFLELECHPNRNFYTRKKEKVVKPRYWDDEVEYGSFYDKYPGDSSGRAPRGDVLAKVEKVIETYKKFAANRIEAVINGNIDEIKEYCDFLEIDTTKKEKEKKKRGLEEDDGEMEEEREEDMEREENEEIVEVDGVSEDNVQVETDELIEVEEIPEYDVPENEHQLAAQVHSRIEESMQGGGIPHARQQKVHVDTGYDREGQGMTRGLGRGLNDNKIGFGRGEFGADMAKFPKEYGSGGEETPGYGSRHGGKIGMGGGEDRVHMERTKDGYGSRVEGATGMRYGFRDERREGEGTISGGMEMESRTALGQRIDQPNPLMMTPQGQFGSGYGSGGQAQAGF